MSNNNTASQPTTAQPTPKNTVVIEIPEGMTKEQYLKLLGTFEKGRDYTAKRDKCVRTAFNLLKEKYPTEYKRFLNQELTKAGLPVKS